MANKRNQPDPVFDDVLRRLNSMTAEMETVKNLVFELASKKKKRTKKIVSPKERCLAINAYNRAQCLFSHRAGSSFCAKHDPRRTEKKLNPPKNISKYAKHGFIRPEKKIISKRERATSPLLFSDDSDDSDNETLELIRPTSESMVF